MFPGGAPALAPGGGLPPLPVADPEPVGGDLGAAVGGASGEELGPTSEPEAEGGGGAAGAPGAGGAPATRSGSLMTDLTAKDLFQMSFTILRFGIMMCMQRAKVTQEADAKKNWLKRGQYIKSAVGRELKALQGSEDRAKQKKALENTIKVSRAMFGATFSKACLQRALQAIKKRKDEAAAAGAGGGAGAGGRRAESKRAERPSPKGAAPKAKGGKKRKAESPPAKAEAAAAEPKKPKKSHKKKKPEPKKADAGGDGGAGDGDLQLVKENLPRAGEEEGDILKDAAINEEEEWEERQTATRRAGDASGGDRERALVGGGVEGLLGHVARAAGLTGASGSALEVMADAVDILLQRVLLRAAALSAHRLAGARPGQRQVEVTSEPLERVLEITRREKAKAERVDAPSVAASRQADLDAEVAERRRKGELQTEEQLKQFMRERENRLKVANATDAARSLGGLGDARWAKWSQFGAKGAAGGGEKGKAAADAPPAGGLAERTAAGGAGVGAGGLAARMAAAKEGLKGEGGGAGGRAGEGSGAAGAAKPKVAWKDLVAAMEREPQYARSRWFASVVMAGPCAEEK